MRILIIGIFCLIVLVSTAATAKQAIMPPSATEATLMFGYADAIVIAQTEDVDENEVLIIYAASAGDTVLYHRKLIAIDIGKDGAFDKAEIHLCELDWSAKQLGKLFKTKKIFYSTDLGDVNPILAEDLVLMGSFLKALDNTKEQDIIDALELWFDLRYAVEGDFVK